MVSDDGSERRRRGKHHGKRNKGGICQCLPRIGLSVILIPCAISGFVLGLWLKSQELTENTIYLLGFPGQLILRAYFMIMIPLLFCSIVLGISSMRKGISSMICLTIMFFLILSTTSAIMGAVAGHVVHPGKPLVEFDSNSSSSNHSTLSPQPMVVVDCLTDLFWNSIPNNLIEAAFTMERNAIRSVDIENEGNTKELDIQKKPGTNYMGLIIFSIVFGCALASLGDKGEQLLQIFEQGHSAIMNIAAYCVRILPIGMFFWMMRQAIMSTYPEKIFGTLAMFLATMCTCLAFHQLILLPFLYLVIVRKNPVVFHMNLMPAILTAFGSSSSIATLPVSIRCTEGFNRVNPTVTRFVLPFGMVAHMNGGTFYMVLSVIFLAQLEGITLGIMQTIYLCLTCILLYISTSGTPSQGNPVNLLTALASVGITNSAFVPLMVTIDWLMERFRTMMNIVTDCYVAAYVEKICEENLPEDNRESIEFETPLIDGYDHRAHPGPANMCKTCGRQIT